MAKVKLISFTGIGCEQEYAARLLVFTKNTRLQMTPDGLETTMLKPWREIEEELSYMASTIQSSWEFVDLTFSIEKVTRAVAQQITRTRTASYAMQSQRVTDMSKMSYEIPYNLPTDSIQSHYEMVMTSHMRDYRDLLEMGVAMEDARGVLPMNIHCNLLAKYNLRSLVDLVLARESGRAQPEYQDIARQMKQETLRVWPWAAKFFKPKNELAVELLSATATAAMDDPGVANNIRKAIDLIKKG